jgi:hypothetical protein
VLLQLVWLLLAVVVVVVALVVQVPLAAQAVKVILSMLQLCLQVGAVAANLTYWVAGAEVGAALRALLAVLAVLAALSLLQEQAAVQAATAAQVVVMVRLAAEAAVAPVAEIRLMEPEVVVVVLDCTGKDVMVQVV